MEAVAVHVNSNPELANPLRVSTGAEQDAYAVLDHLDEGVVLCSAEGGIQYHNRSFEQICLESHLFRPGESRQLSFRKQKNNIIFKELVNEVLSDVTGSLHTPYSDTACVMDGEQRYLVKIRPRIEDRSGLWDTQVAAGYLLFIRAAGSKRVPSARRIAALHPVTRSESEICHYLSRGMAADDIARTRNVAPSTVRQQIKAVMSKLDCHKQGELVAYLLTNTLM
jgi:DNA-binding CsgD family transcriptional regulator